jgi:hypothetical protein
MTCTKDSRTTFTTELTERTEGNLFSVRSVGSVGSVLGLLLSALGLLFGSGSAGLGLAVFSCL